MNVRTKDRLITAGVVVVICATAVVLPGCGTVNSRSEAGGDQYSSPHAPHSQPRKPYHERCNTDMECEMQEAVRQHNNDQPRWKMWTSIGVGVLVTGWLYARNQDKGGGVEALGGDKSIQPVTCAAKGCAF